MWMAVNKVAGQSVYISEGGGVLKIKGMITSDWKLDKLIVELQIKFYQHGIWEFDEC